MSRNLGALTLLDLSGPAWPVMGVFYLYLFLPVSAGFTFQKYRKKEIYL
jgi:hypothetical protein